jgi:DNA polymerase
MGHYSLNDLVLAGVKWELREVPNAAPKIKEASPARMSETSIIPPTAPVARSTARSLAGGAGDLGALKSAIGGFDHPLKQFANNTVMPFFGKKAGLLIVTDIPSGGDDASGNILTGPAGELMDKMLSAIESDRAEASIVPLVFWRTPGGRAPAREELDLARPFVDRAAELLEPAAILTLGTLAATEIAGAKLPGQHGVIFENKIMPIYHPNFLILKPGAKREVWEALQSLRNLLKNA